MIMPFSTVITMVPPAHWVHTFVGLISGVVKPKFLNLFYPFKEAHVVVSTLTSVYMLSYTVYFHHFEIAHGHVFLCQTVYDVSTKFVGCELIDTFSLWKLDPFISFNCLWTSFQNFQLFFLSALFFNLCLSSSFLRLPW